MRLTAALVALFVVAGCKSESLPQVTCAFYWTIEKDGKTSHLLGTIHGGIAGKQLPKQVWNDHAKAKTVVVEADVEDTSVQSMMKRPPGPSLRDELGNEYWDKLNDLVGTAVASALDDMKTIVTVSVITQQLMPRQVTAMDAVALRRARVRSQKVVFLETLAEQIEVFEKYVGIREIKLVLDDPKRAKAELDKLIAAYMVGDEAQMQKVFDEQEADSLKQGYTQAELDDQREGTLYRRNEAWIPQLQSILADGNAFIAVGAAHTIGPRSVNELLAKQGYTFTRIACSAPAASGSSRQ